MGHFALLDLDPESEYGSGSTDLIESGSNPDPDLVAVTIPRLLIYTVHRSKGLDIFKVTAKSYLKPRDYLVSSRT